MVAVINEVKPTAKIEQKNSRALVNTDINRPETSTARKTSAKKVVPVQRIDVDDGLRTVDTVNNNNYNVDETIDASIQSECTESPVPWTVSHGSHRTWLGKGIKTTVMKVTAKLRQPKSQRQRKQTPPDPSTSYISLQLLLAATYHNICSEMKSLIQSNPSVISVGFENGDTLLHIVTKEKCFECCSNIIKYGKTSVNVRNQFGITPLMLACERNAVDICQLILNAAIELNELHKVLSVTTLSGETVLHTATSCGYYYHNACPRLLLQYGPNINVQTYTGITALHHVVYQPPDEYYLDTLLDFIDAGASVDIAGRYEDIQSGTPVTQFQLALLFKNIYAIVIFIEAGFRIPVGFIRKKRSKLRFLQINSALKDYIMNSARTPRSLKSLCRVSIRMALDVDYKTVSEKGHDIIHLPNMLQRYVHFEDVRCYAKDLVKMLDINNETVV